MKLIFMGTPDFAVSILEALVKAGHEITLVVSQPDRPKGRGHKYAPTAVKDAAQKLGLPVFQPQRLKDPDTVSVLEETPADACIVAAYGQLLPGSILHMKKYGCINVHASLLPAYRGAAPVQWAVINGEKESGVTIMQMDEGLDTGDILMQRSITLADDETSGSLFDRLSGLGAELLAETLTLLEKGTLTPVKQQETTTAYALMITKETARINWNLAADDIERLIRGMSPAPGCHTYLNERVLKIWKAKVIPGDSDAKPGTVISAGKEEFTVSCGKNRLSILELQLQGKKRMDCASFLRGFRMDEGMVLL